MALTEARRLPHDLKTARDWTVMHFIHPQPPANFAQQA
jgi:hypothetical protein